MWIVIFIHILIDCGRSPPAATITWTWRVATPRRGILRIFINAGYILYIRKVRFHRFITLLPNIENNRVFLRILQELFQLDCTSCLEISDEILLPISPFPCQKSDHINVVIQCKVDHLRAEDYASGIWMLQQLGTNPSGCGQLEWWIGQQVFRYVLGETFVVPECSLIVELSRGKRVNPVKERVQQLIGVCGSTRPRVTFINTHLEEDGGRVHVSEHGPCCVGSDVPSWNNKRL